MRKTHNEGFYLTVFINKGYINMIITDKLIARREKNIQNCSDDKNRKPQNN